MVDPGTMALIPVTSEKLGNDQGQLDIFFGKVGEAKDALGDRLFQRQSSGLVEYERVDVPQHFERLAILE